MMSSVLRIPRVMRVLTLTVFLTACQTVADNKPATDATLIPGEVNNLVGSMDPVIKEANAEETILGSGSIDDEATSPSPIEKRTVPTIGDQTGNEEAPIGTKRPRLGNERLTVALPPQPVPEFVNSVFGEILGLGFVLGPGVSDLNSIVAFRSANNIREADLYDSAVAALRTYGVAVYQGDEQLQVVLEDDLRRSAPRFIRSRARSSVPSGLRPVVQFVDLFAISVDEIFQILKQSFPDEDTLVMFPNPNTNTMTLTGLPQDVDRALSIINQMDELRFGGQSVATLRVDNWEALELAEAVFEILNVEGYSVSARVGTVRPITLRAIEFTNQLVIFAKDESMLDYAVQTALRLDQAAVREEEVEIPRIYKAQHYKAADLISLLATLDREDPEGGGQDELGGGSLTAGQVATQPSQQSQGSDNGGDSGSATTVQGRFVADEQSNRIVFNATEKKYRETLALLRQLDTPPPEVLVEVTIAEITLTANTLSGLEFLINEIGSTGFSVGTSGGIGLATGGLTGSYSSSDGTVDFGAFANNNLIQVLSTPRIVTKSGATASIQVGTDVPIITSQAAAQVQAGGTSSILQSVEYRETGILLDVSPIVLSSDRIDLDITQEVSSAEDNENQAIASPIISSRRLTSQLTLQDGQSAILGGLMETRNTEGGSGVPFLKDIPILGRAFSTETLRKSDTILLVMITPYILDTADDRARAVDAFATFVNDAYSRRDEAGNTLIQQTEPPVVITRSPIEADADQ
ncbi:MAG: secretin N-terminal domain-containing protein [Pseudomonadota bacterium]